MDLRDAQTWVALELTRLGEEKIQEGSLVRTLCQDLRVSNDYPIFIPAASFPKGNRRITIVLMEGYAFVASGLPDVRYFAIEEQAYLSKVMSVNSGKHGMRTVVTLPDVKIEELRLQLRQRITVEISLGANVRVVDGTYKNLEGVVQGFDGENAFVEIHLRSIELVASLPRVLLEVTDTVD